MAREFFKDWNPSTTSVALVRTANNIIREYSAAGYILTLRQLYYQFVSRDLIDNTEKSYKNLGNVITKARMAGMMDWDAIEDRNREFNKFYFQESDDEVIKDLHYNIAFDFWLRQPIYVEVWVEKEALGNVIEKACQPYKVPHMACKGYLSASEAWRAGKRMNKALARGQECVIIHLGDHDPSGIDMTRDNDERANLFSGYDGEVEIRRIALNRDQIDQYNPPPNPAKVTDSRAKDYIKKHGATSWELDALEPSVMVDLIQKEFKPFIDKRIWNATINLEEEKKTLLKKLSSKWDDIKNEL